MSHLSAERLAALVNDPPNGPELAHLTSCPECAREREAFQQLSLMAAVERDRIGVPLTSWERLGPALARDESAMLSNRRWRTSAWGRAAAAVLLLLGGVAVGRLSTMRSATAVASGQQPAVSDTNVRFASLDDARRAQAQSQAVYQQATAFVAQHDTVVRPSGDSPAGMRTRLAALDRVLETTGAALNQAPYDPVINGYYLTTLGQREATLRQLRTSMPAGAGITSY